MIRLVGLIKAAGGEYVMKASTVDVFATFEEVQEAARRAEIYDAEQAEITDSLFYSWCLLFQLAYTARVLRELLT